MFVHCTVESKLISFRSNYRNLDGTMTAAALRARRPYAVRNAIFGASLMGFAIFCCK